MSEPDITLRDPWPLLRWTRAILQIQIVVNACLVAFSVGVIALKRDPYIIDPHQIQLLAMAISYVQLANVVSLVIGAILGALLTYRTMKNVHALRGAGARVTPLWSVLWYIVPIANVVMPPKAVSQIWDGTFGDSVQAKQRGKLIWWWWIAIVASIILHQIALRATLSSGPMTPSVGDILHPLSYALAAISALFFIRVFTLIARAQNIQSSRNAA